VVKAQVLVGGRGKAGGIKFASSVEEVESATKTLLGSEIKGERVGAVLIEPKLDISRELYLLGSRGIGVRGAQWLSQALKGELTLRR